jgi:hypothetical protein
MTKHLNALLVNLAGLDTKDAQLPITVLLPMTRQHLARPIMNLHRILSNDPTAETLSRELAHLALGDTDMAQFLTDGRLRSNNSEHGHDLLKVHRISTSMQAGEAGDRDQHALIVWLLYYIQDRAPMGTPGRNVVYLLRYLWFLSFQKELWSTVEAMDPYLSLMPEIIQGRYDGALS